MANKHVDAIIVGAGAGGGIVAKQLACAGMSVVLFERGGWPNYDDHTNDELVNQRTQVVAAVHGPDRRKYQYSVDMGGGKTRVPPPYVAHSIIAACVGSGTVTYGAMAWRFMPQDFRLKSIYGELEGSSLEDWPISYDELEPYYDMAEYEIGVAGDNSTNPFGPPRKRPFPMPAFEYNKEAKIVEAAAKRIGLHPFPIPMLRNSVRYNGRAACIRNRTCCGYVCPIDAKNGTQNTVIPVAMATGNCEVRTDCVVAEIIMDGAVAKGVKYFDAEKKIQTQTANVVVIAASAAESARLMLNSKSERFPNGVGNNFDMVGRNLQSHPYSGAQGLFDHDVLELNGPGATIAMSDLNHMPQEKMFSGVLCTEFYQLPYRYAMNRAWGKPKWGAEHKKFQRESYRKVIRIHGPIQDVPMADNRVCIDPKLKDWWGIPAMSFRPAPRHPRDAVHGKIMADKAEQLLKEAGAVEVWKAVGGAGGGSTGGQHQCGTCRMGDDRKNSVTDKNCKVWDTDNLYIGDGSVMVTDGGFNPVLTIMALAYRTGEIIAKAHAKKSS